MKILCCIPARYGSSRLEGKPLLKINGKTIINHTYEKALETKVDKVVVLTDDDRIHDEVLSFGGNSFIITENCLNGTERILKYLEKIDHVDYDIIVNIQGDEPFVNSSHVDLAIDNYLEKQPVCSTICFKTLEKHEIESKSRGKAVVDINNNIVYCSRNVIPSNKKENVINGHEYNIHVGIFIFNKDYLINKFTLPNTPLQLLEDIEWLKIIEQGYKINTIFVDYAERGIDTQEDYNYLKKKYE